MARVRDTKLRAQRIQLDYFKRRHPLRRGRLWLGLLAVVATGGWVAHMVRTPDRMPVAPGPVSSGHALIGQRCETCHDAEAGTSGRWLAATDAACASCHRTADHQQNERETPPCTSCHQE